MTDPGRGHRFLFQLGKEAAATYGTAVAATGLRLWGYNFKAKPNLGLDEEDALGTGLGLREVYQTARLWDWDFETDLNYIGMLKLLNMICGDDTSPATPAVAGPDGNGIYTHTFKLGLNVQGFTGEVQEGGPGAVATGSQFKGMVAEKMTISGKSGMSTDARLRVKISGYARDRVSGFALTVLTLANPRSVQYRHATIVDDGSADAAADVLVKGWQLELSSPMDRERFPFGNSALIAAPMRDKRPRAVMTFSQEFQTFTHYTDFLANNDLTPEMEFTGPELVGAAGARSIKFTMAKARIIDHDPPADKWGPLQHETKFLALQDAASSTLMTITVKTDQATVALG